MKYNFIKISELYNCFFFKERADKDILKTDKQPKENNGKNDLNKNNKMVPYEDAEHIDLNEENIHEKKQTFKKENSSDKTQKQFNPKLNDKPRNHKELDVLNTPLNISHPYQNFDSIKANTKAEFEARESLQEDIDLDDDSTQFGLKIVGYAKQVQERMKQRQNKRLKK